MPAGGEASVYDQNISWQEAQEGWGGHGGLARQIYGHTVGWETGGGMISG